MSAPQPSYKFSDIIAEPRIRERWEKVRRYFFLRESTFDMSNRCNIRCEGCYYFTGEKQFAAEEGDTKAWQALMEGEKERGITFAVLAGAEPSLVPHLCEICYKVIPHGAIATNGLKVIPREIDYRIHISVWGNDETSRNIRKAGDMLARQMANYKDDPRYNIVAHTGQRALHDLFSCSYPRKNPSTDIGLGRSFRQYRTDLQWDREAACCVPDTDCDDCRHYAAGSAVVTARMYRHATDPLTFSAWLDYVDTYLAVWVRGYQKGQNLCDTFVSPPPTNA